MKSVITLVFVSVVLIFVLINVNTTNGKTSISELEEKMDDNTKAIEEAQSSILSNNAEMSLRQNEILSAELKIAEFSKIIFGLENDIVSKEEEIDLTLIKLDETNQQKDEYYNHTKERIKIMYEYGSTEYLEVLLESKTTGDFFNRLEYLNKLVEYDQSMLDELEHIKNSIVEYETSLLLEKVDLEKIKEENNQNLNTVEALRVVKKQEIEKIEKNRDLLFEQIQLMEAEQEKLDAKIQELIILYSDKDLLFGGKLDWPLPGYSRISSSFGPRIHPVYGYKSTHTGIDIPGGYGSKIRAAASGQVIFAGWGNAYGNFILVDHGVDKNKRHIITQYAHCSSLLVVEGDVVVRGDTIAKVGSTGWSTGNHLHFGVQLGGTWINPLDKTDR